MLIYAHLCKYHRQTDGRTSQKAKKVKIPKSDNFRLKHGELIKKMTWGMGYKMGEIRKKCKDFLLI